MELESLRMDKQRSTGNQPIAAKHNLADASSELYGNSPFLAIGSKPKKQPAVTTIAQAASRKAVGHRKLTQDPIRQ